jgi:bifunctional non-homologous end joining protein LigD
MLWRTQAQKRQPPGFIEPCIPTAALKPPIGPQWIHEIKHDGYRLIVRKQGARVRLLTRRGYDWTDRYPLIVKAAAKLRASSVTIDGEAVSCDQAGVADFAKLHSRAHDDWVFLYVFDLLELDGVGHRPFPLEERKSALAQLLQGGAASGKVRWPPCPTSV